MHPFGRFPALSLREMTATAVTDAVSDAGTSIDEIQVVFFANAFDGVLSGQESLRGQANLHHAGVRDVPIVNVENACAGGSTALWLAVRAVASGEFDTALAVGAEKMFVGDRERTLSALQTASDTEMTRGQGLQFVALYSMRIQDRLDAGSVEMRHLAGVTRKNQLNGALNPLAQFGAPMTEEDVLNARRIAGPLTLPMVSGISDGAAAVVVSKTAGSGHQVRVRSSVLRSGTVDELADLANVRAIQQAYADAGIGPEDLDVLEVHDATAPSELIYYEQLGLCDEGDAGSYFDSGATEISGRTPVNPSGGLTARGHPVGATGLAQICELTWQLRGQAGGRQAGQPRLALAQNSGGWIDGDAAASAVHVLELV